MSETPSTSAAPPRPPKFPAPIPAAALILVGMLGGFLASTIGHRLGPVEKKSPSVQPQIYGEVSSVSVVGEGTDNPRLMILVRDRENVRPAILVPIQSILRGEH